MNLWMFFFLFFFNLISTLCEHTDLSFLSYVYSLNINQSINQPALFRLAKFLLEGLSTSTIIFDSNFRYCDTFPL
jgi:hypothetical protein